MNFRDIIESAQDVIYIVDPEMKISYGNPSTAKLLGSKPEKVAGKKIDSLFPESFQKTQIESVKKVFQTGKIIRMEKEFSDRAGIWFDTLFSPLRNSKGEIYAVLAISRDISIRKHET